MTLTYSHGREFVEEIRPSLERGDVTAFLRHLRVYWPAAELCSLLQCGHEDAVCAALAGLTFVGTMEDCPAIAVLLHDDDGLTADLAEHALWSIWFRAGEIECNQRLAQVVRLISQSDLDKAEEIVAEVLGVQPRFAEAHHQFSLIHFLRGEYAQAIGSCQTALSLNPWHFGAMATLGHSHAAMGQLDLACAAYKRALQLHPRLQGVRQAIRQIRGAAGSSSVNSFTNF